MIGQRVAVATMFAVAVIGCGEDGPDVPGAGGSGGESAASEIAPTIHDEMDDEMDDGTTHDDTATHDDGATHDTATVDDTGTQDDTAHDDAAHDDGAMHDDAAHADGATHDDNATHDDGATHDDDTAHDDMTHDDMTHDDATHDDGAHDDETDDGHEADAVADTAGVVVSVEMNEFGYVLDRNTVPMGEPVTFSFVNVGIIEHEAMFGDAHQQDEFEASGDHGDHDGDAGHHGDVVALSLDAGEAGELTTVFDSPGEVLIGCHLPGHWNAGMVSSFTVLDA